MECVGTVGAADGRTIVSVGCIGCGNMGSALLKGLSCRENFVLYGYNPHSEALDRLAVFGVRPAPDAASLARTCDVLLVAVKPGVVASVLEEIRPHVAARQVVISIAAGITLDSLRRGVDSRCPVVRVMPNTPALVRAGQFAVCLDDPSLTSAQKECVCDLFSGLGLVLQLPESTFNSFSAVAGCGPAYVFYVMDAISEAAVTLGFPRSEAVTLTISLFAGCARLAAEPGAHLATLREQVCSPAGMTIAATNRLEQDAVRGSIIRAVLAAAARGREMER